MNAALILQMIATLRELQNLLHWLLMVMFVSGQKLNSGSSFEVCCKQSFYSMFRQVVIYIVYVVKQPFVFFSLIKLWCFDN